MIINVTRQDIRNGDKDGRYSCPVALAIKRHTQNPDVVVDEEIAEISGKYYELPRSATRFILKFDKTGKGKPFKFRLI